MDSVPQDFVCFPRRAHRGVAPPVTGSCRVEVAPGEPSSTCLGNSCYVICHHLPQHLLTLGELARVLVDVVERDLRCRTFASSGGLEQVSIQCLGDTLGLAFPQFVASRGDMSVPLFVQEDCEGIVVSLLDRVAFFPHTICVGTNNRAILREEEGEGGLGRTNSLPRETEILQKDHSRLV